MKDLKLEGISENLKFIFTNKGVLELSSVFSNREKNNIIEYSHNNLDIAADILKEHIDLSYKLGKISLVEYSNSARKFLYSLMETLNFDNQISIINEWENKFGSKLLLINESVNKLIIESRVNDSWNSIKQILQEDWYNPLSWDWKGAAKRTGEFVKDTAKGVSDWTVDQSKQIKQKGLGGYIKDKAASVWNGVKNAVSKAWKCLTNDFVECLMEGLRTMVFSAAGMGAMVGVSMIPGVGQIADVIVFGLLLIWDIYKALSGKYEEGQYKWSFADIIVDAVCTLLPALGAGLKAALRGIRTAGELAVTAVKKGGIIAKAVNLLKTGLSKILGYIGQAAKWAGEKLGIKWLENFGSKAQNFMTKTAEEISSKTGNVTLKAGETNIAKPGLNQKAGKVFDKGIKRLDKAEEGVKQFLKDFKFNKPTPVVVKKMGTTVLITATICAALGLDDPWMCRHKVENGEVTPEQIAQVENSLKSKAFVDKLNSLSVEQSPW